jgi:hypothetical protein
MGNSADFGELLAALIGKKELGAPLDDPANILLSHNLVRKIAANVLPQSADMHTKSKMVTSQAVDAQLHSILRYFRLERAFPAVTPAL